MLMQARSRWSISPLSGKNPERKHKDRANNLKHEIEGQPDNPEGQQDEPDDREKEKQKQSDGPTED